MVKGLAAFLDPHCSCGTLDTFINRREILDAVCKNLDSFHGKVLVVGCGQKPYRSLLLAPPSRAQEYIGLDLDNGYGSPDLIWDGHRIPLDANSVDCAMATEVFEHCPDIEAVLNEILRVLKPGGFLLFTVPFLWPLHDSPHDEYRYTPFSLKRHLQNAGYGEIKLEAMGGWDASLAQMLGLWVRRRPMAQFKRRLLSIVAAPLIRYLIKIDRKSPVYTDQVMITGISGVAIKQSVQDKTSNTAINFEKPKNDSGKASAFWRERMLKNGHTGWMDRVLYIFDQRERLEFIKRIITQESLTSGRALDFGCGSGDFSKMLLKMGFGVCGFDPFVKPDVCSDDFTYVNTYEQLSKVHKVDLALSVTTLDHLKDENDANDALAAIRACLKTEGVFYMLEYALDSEGDRQKNLLRNNYQSFRTISEWETLLKRASLRIVEVIPAHHPIFNPSKGYLVYHQSLLARIGRMWPTFPLASFWLHPKLNKLAATSLKTHPYDRNVVFSSPLKLIRCAPTTAG